MPTAKKKQPPIQGFLNGTAKSNVWLNEKNGRPYVTVENIYKKEDGTWSSNAFFSPGQLPNLAQSILEARQYCRNFEREQQDAVNEAEAETEAA